MTTSQRIFFIPLETTQNKVLKTSSCDENSTQFILDVCEQKKLICKKCTTDEPLGECSNNWVLNEICDSLHYLAEKCFNGVWFHQRLRTNKLFVLRFSTGTVATWPVLPPTPVKSLRHFVFKCFQREQLFLCLLSRLQLFCHSIKIVYHSDMKTVKGN